MDSLKFSTRIARTSSEVRESVFPNVNSIYSKSPLQKELKKTTTKSNKTKKKKKKKNTHKKHTKNNNKNKTKLKKWECA